MAKDKPLPNGEYKLVGPSASGSGMRGKLAYLPRAQCNPKELRARARKDGVAGFVVDYDCQPGLLSPVPVIKVANAITEAFGALLSESRLAVRLKFRGKASFFADRLRTHSATATSGAAAGPPLQYKLSPEIMAPGYSLFTTALTPKYYTIESATSLASAYMCGIAALFIHSGSPPESGVPRLNSAVFKQVMQNKAMPAMVRGTSLAEPVLWQGAGLVRLDRAFLSTAGLSPSVIEFGDRVQTVPSSNGQITATMTVHNYDLVPETFAVAHVPAMAEQRISKNGAILSTPKLSSSEHATLSAGSMRFEVPPGDNVVIAVTLDLPQSAAHANNWIYSGYIVVYPARAQDGLASKQALYAPYFWLNGHYHTIANQQVFGSTRV
ncbi:hypothetical protein SYNPS1DRAFT_20515 [Syncephalis pseudoplumigaleata]|uniref:Peptidase S8/S53 domain-containing protein n=1 Tax=Syncephalis pseudoplumigaleata TaxID=1712513 RepID=A0A4P9Z8S4_9FUNG|nr:hypothetical protein SYNPS1DRAFT_20515 [Syncephalis pseudoplumigaleata]|eukprot:RKP28150.1 hypothetical protein SYNPS1DRAFT_20515 [Syncephalis pseudoplumigaleata]